MSTDDIQQLFKNNRAWAAQMTADDPDFFARLAAQQAPEYMWIGCSDSRVPANVIMGLMPGDVFVHRNVANVVIEDDPNCMAAVDFAVNTLKVRHIIVCGHYGCGGVLAAMENSAAGVVDDWITTIKSLWSEHKHRLGKLERDDAHLELCELNVRRQVRSLCNTKLIQGVWASGQALDVHGWIYGIENGLLKSLDERIGSPEGLTAQKESSS